MLTDCHFLLFDADDKEKSSCKLIFWTDLQSGVSSDGDFPTRLWEPKKFLWELPTQGPYMILYKKFFNY